MCVYKQVIIIRKDLKLQKGKLAAQVAHASLSAYRKATPAAAKAWESEGEKKVVVKVDSLEELMKLYELATFKKLPCALIKDAGRTQVPKGTITAVGIGPAREKDIDAITGKLKIL